MVNEATYPCTKTMVWDDLFNQLLCKIELQTIDGHVSFHAFTIETDATLEVAQKVLRAIDAEAEGAYYAFLCTSRARSEPACISSTSSVRLRPLQPIVFAHLSTFSCVHVLVPCMGFVLLHTDPSPVLFEHGSYLQVLSRVLYELLHRRASSATWIEGIVATIDYGPARHPLRLQNKVTVPKHKELKAVDSAQS